MSASTNSPGAAVTTSAQAASFSSSGGSGYRRRAIDGDGGYFPFLNSPNRTTFKAGPNIAARGLVCLVNSSSDPTTNFAGFFQLNAVSDSDSEGNILEAYYSWYLASAGVGSNVFSEVSVFFLKGDAPTKYTGNPMTDPNVISDIATSQFFINGDNATTTMAPASVETPLAITLFTPRQGQNVGLNGSGWDVDLVVVNNDPAANYFSPSNGVTPLYHDNFTDPNFKPGVVSEALPGLVVLSSTSTLAGGNATNLANLFQIGAVTGVKNNTITEFWMTWLVGAAFAGVGQESNLTIYVVNGTAPPTIGTAPTNIISNIVQVNFNISSNVQTTGTGSSPAITIGAASNIAASAGALILGILAFLV
ncbi:hypothetical protein GE09DRAFT_1061341 [Coniochaeta sp. 2T2.1]|nr:hypothetical protein GE09DRAFT_1061341 [Coniochaeta sp. 2T2.1]